MSAIVCGKRSSIFEDLPSSSPSSAGSPSSPPSAKRIRCSSFSPPRSAAAASLFSAASWTSVSTPLGYLVARFPSMDKELLEKALHECGNDLDSAIKSLNELFLGSGENMGSATGKPDASLEASTQILNQGNSTSNGGDGTPQEQPSANKQPPINREEFVEIFVREMTMASNIDDAKARASRALEVFEKSIYANASETATQSFQQENLILKQQLEALLQENNILKRAVSIQHERQKEFEERGQEVNQLKQLLAQYQEQLRTLEGSLFILLRPHQVNNYALAMHLKQAQQSNSMPGRFNPDIF
ncbi:PREDICTED: uncharacterized protein LOC109184013 isoform X1 [Ipomoea nil]|uniref:uncharacterized protein LOC109184013 isoform X1 n=1 Tax=Ipomoea nil TaxID=35883 RepID=UPI0009018CDA|nr:PREDICTED: uncharacterized protein LOC109184013 isoform X1 [Ipomoea nil]